MRVERGRTVTSGEAVDTKAGDQPSPSPDDVALLWAAASPAPVAQDVRHAADGADLSLVLETAAAHRVAPLVLRALDAAGVWVAPGSTPAAAQGSLWRARAELALPAAARAALLPLTEAGFEPLVLKGLALVDRYPASGLRPMDDIDLLVPAPDVEAAGEVLRKAGWLRVRHHPARDSGYHQVFQHPSIPSVPLELHYEFTKHREIAPGLDGRALWSARVASTVIGIPAWVLPPEIELAALISHAAKGYHLFSRLLWIADLVVLEATSTLDWDEVERRLSRARRRAAGAIALRLAERLGAHVPHRMLKLPLAFERSRRLRAILDPEAPFGFALRPRWMAWMMVDGVPGKLRFVAEDLRHPTEGHSRGRISIDLASLAVRGIRRLAFEREPMSRPTSQRR
jgi:hypothetical protein